MILGRVIDPVIATQKHASFDGTKLLLVQPLNLSLQPEGDPLLAIDAVDAGVGDTVLVVQDGWAACHLLGQKESPVDAGIIGIVDSVDLDPPATNMSPPAETELRQSQGRERDAAGDQEQAVQDRHHQKKP
ncbi:MAG: EutN/CcmL family microcompartment protein [Acidobacteriota bacterium]